MAVVYSTFTKSVGLAKANIRYIQHRAGKDGQKLTRTLFGFDGVIERKEAYEMIDEALKDTHFYRISLNPDPKWEDRENDLDLKGLTIQTMRALEEQLGKPIEFVASIHADHTQRRHVNLLAFVSQMMNKRDLNFLRNTLTSEAKSQRKELDLVLGKKERGQEREQDKAQGIKQELELER
jgi:hypothetical protein